MDFVQDRLFPGMDKRRAALVTKGICAAFVLLSYLIANSNTPILDMMSYSWGILSGSFLAPYLISLYWKGINRRAPGPGCWAASSSPCRRWSASCSSLPFPSPSSAR